MKGAKLIAMLAELTEQTKIYAAELIEIVFILSHKKISE